jgi:predicted transcriptional regulator
MEPESEIVSDVPVGPRRKAAKKAAPERREAIKEMTVGGMTQREIGDVLGVSQAAVGIDLKLEQNCSKDAATIERAIQDAEIREFVVERIPQNPRLVLAAYEEDGVKQVVKVWVGINRNFRQRMRLSAQRGANENAPWELVGRRPRLPGRW